MRLGRLPALLLFAVLAAAPGVCLAEDESSCRPRSSRC